MPDYDHLIGLAIGRMSKIVNEDVALRQARKVPDLEVDDDGTVTELRGPGKGVLKELVDAYSEVMGGVAESLIAYEIRDHADVEHDDLPDNITKHL